MILNNFCSALNHLVIGKYFLNVKALNSTRKFYIFNEFVSLACDKISLEKYISCTTGREKEFRTKWSVFSFLKYGMKFYLLNWLRSHLILVTSNVFIVLGFFFVSFKL